MHAAAHFCEGHALRQNYPLFSGKGVCHGVRVDNFVSSQRRDVEQSASEPFINLRPVWLRIPEAVRTRGVGRSTLYTLIAEGKVKSRLLKARRDSMRGIRLVSADSLDEFIERAEQ